MNWNVFEPSMYYFIMIKYSVGYNILYCSWYFIFILFRLNNRNTNEFCIYWIYITCMSMIENYYIWFFFGNLIIFFIMNLYVNKNSWNQISSRFFLYFTSYFSFLLEVWYSKYIYKNQLVIVLKNYTCIF